VPSWFPDWSGKAAAIVASGPSAKLANLSLLRGKMPVLAIKESYELCNWADVVYGCDPAWWKFRAGLPKFAGTKVSWEGSNLSQYPDIRNIKLDASQDRVFPIEKRQYRMVFDNPGVIGGGGNSGFQAVNMAVQFGAKKLVLIGFDMHDRSGVHFYGRNYWSGANNPDETCFVRWRRHFDRAAADLEMQGVEVINATPNTALTCFRRGTIEQAIAGWK
jgi:hypothetical protein